jgi:hypothetical protein
VTTDLNVQSALPQFNQTNLAIKGVLGIAAMARISVIVGNEVDAKQYDVRSLPQLHDFPLFTYYVPSPPFHYKLGRKQTTTRSMDPPGARLGPLAPVGELWSAVEQRDRV